MFALGLTLGLIIGGLVGIIGLALFNINDNEKK